MRIDRLLLAATAVALPFLLLAPDTLAGKPGGGAPPPDPAIACRMQTQKALTTDHDLVVMNADGTNRRTVVDGTAGQRFSGPDWSPDGTKLVFLSDVQGPGVYVVNVDGTGLAKVVAVDAATDPDFWFGHIPRWSPVATADGRSKIAYVTTHTGGVSKALWVVNTDGTGAAQLTTGTALSYRLHGVNWITWAPDASSVAVGFLSGANDGSDVVVHGLGLVDGALAITSSWNLTDDASVPGGTLNSLRVGSPCWSRTGNRIAVDASPAAAGEQYNVWIIDLTNPASPTRASPDPTKEQLDPCWSPDDGRLVVYQGVGSLFTMNPDGSGLLKIAASPKSSFIAPAWRRNP